MKRGTTGVGDVGVGAELLGMTDTDAADALESPMALVATTLNVYAVPLASPDTTHDVAPEVVHVSPPGDAVTVYPVTAPAITCRCGPRHRHLAATGNPRHARRRVRHHERRIDAPVGRRLAEAAAGSASPPDPYASGGCGRRDPCRPNDPDSRPRVGQIG